jgi:GNAT superfamily N-acetyltransferase
MPDIEFCPLPSTCQPLLDKFYRAHRSPMRSSSAAQSWIARAGEIVAALSLTPVADGYWLTGLFVAPGQRGQGLATDLMAHALADLEGPVWLFCDPQLQRFYQRSGFAPSSSLPLTLGERLMRYSRNKALIALTRNAPDPA